jgi:crossover junction endodeoxyribonuclease RuvC
MSSKSLTILGVDPGFALTGLGVIKQKEQQLKLVDFDCIKTRAGDEYSQRLRKVNHDLKKYIKKYQPDLIAVEELFFAKNVKTALKVGQARGVVLLTAIQAKVPVVEFTPLQVKQAISGYGRADKKQVQQMVKLMLKLKQVPQPDDAADALAVAICAANSQKLNQIYEQK